MVWLMEDSLVELGSMLVGRGKDMANSHVIVHIQWSHTIHVKPQEIKAMHTTAIFGGL